MLLMLITVCSIQAQSQSNYSDYGASDKTNILFENFDNNKNGWETNGGSLKIENSRYYLKADEENIYPSIKIPINQNRDFEYEFYCGLVSGSFNFYFYDANSFGFNNDNKITIKTYDYTNKKYTYNKRETSDFVSKGYLNKLTIRKVEGTIYYFINEDLFYSKPYIQQKNSFTGFLLFKKTSLQVDYLRVSYLNKKQTANNNGSGEKSQQATQDWILNYFKESAGESWTNINTLNSLVKYAPNSVHAEFDANGNLIILNGLGLYKDKLCLGGHKKNEIGAAIEEFATGEDAVFVDRKTHKVYRYDYYNYADSIVIPLSKVSSFNNFNFKTFTNQIKIYKAQYFYKHTRSINTSCKKCTEIYSRKKRINYPKINYSITIDNTNSTTIPNEFQTPIIENYKDRMHKAINHLIELNKNQSGDNTF